MSRWKRRWTDTRLQLGVLLVASIAAGSLAAILSSRYAGERAQERLLKHAEEMLDVQAQTIDSFLEKYRHLPALAVRRPDVAAVAAMEPGPLQFAAARRILLELAGFSGAVDAGMFRPDGTAIATVSGLLDPGLQGFGQMISVAVQGRLGRATLRESSGRKAYAFAAGVRGRDGVSAVIAIAAPLERIEQAWALSVNPVIAFTGEGHIAAANLPARELAPRIMAASATWTGEQGFAVGGNDSHRAYSRSIGTTGWTLMVLEPQSDVAAATRNATLIAALGTLVFAISGAFAIVRLQELRRRRRAERAEAVRLERRVRQRTRELLTANTRLAVEVKERTSAEAALRKAQTDLVQSAKLAAIGEMSASLAHEYNQPLGAIRGYAENAGRFLERGEAGEARSNLGRILALVERMAVLSRTLKSFARKPRSANGMVRLGEVLRDSILLAGYKAREAGNRIECDFPPDTLTVSGGPVRLSQVFVNLISNAVDANRSGPQGAAVHIGWEVADGEVAVRVRDEGAGIAEEDLRRIFEPFFTTKEVGEGLGLGLSIAYNIVQEMGGRLTARNHPQGGAEFCVRLRLAEAMADAAQ
jgi:two-component system C4-dicarboxylate transport sensor histidine kinase DctB